MRPATGWSLGGLDARRPVTEALLWDIQGPRLFSKRCRQQGQRSRTRVSTARTRRRTAGRLGRGGGPGSGGVATLFSPEPQVLQEGEGEPAQQRVVVQPAPRAALEVVEAELLLELLVRLLAHPARLDGRRQLLEGRVGREVREVVLALAAGAVLAHQPHLLAGQVPAVPELTALGRAHPYGGELGRERPFGAAPPGDAAPRDPRQGGLGRDRGLARHWVLARSTPGRGRPQQPDRGRVDVLHLQDADRPEEPARAQAP